METYLIEGATGEAFAKRMFRLAWDKSCMIGSGFLQDRGELSEDEVWGIMRGAEDYQGADCKKPKSGEVDADYVSGRMMKLHYSFAENSISCQPREWRHDYQSFCGAYKDFGALIDAAAKSLCVSVSKVAEKQTA